MGISILLPDAELNEDDGEIPVFVIDWEMAQLGARHLDHGQMLAEMYMLWLYKRIDAGLWLIEGYTEGLGCFSEALAWRTAVQLGIHLLAFGVVTPGWGSDERKLEVAKMGRDLIVHGWNEDIDWYAQNDLSCLFLNNYLD